MSDSLFDAVDGGCYITDWDQGGFVVVDENGYSLSVHSATWNNPDLPFEFISIFSFAHAVTASNVLMSFGVKPKLFIVRAENYFDWIENVDTPIVKCLL